MVLRAALQVVRYPLRKLVEKQAGQVVNPDLLLPKVVQQEAWAACPQAIWRRSIAN